MTRKSRITIHMVSSLDGFIAKKDGSVDWLESKDHYEKGKTLSDNDIFDFVNSIDCYVMGSRTYEHAVELGWPYGEKPVTVLTMRNIQSDRDSIEFVSGDLKDIVKDKLKPRFQNIWVVGGAEVIKEFIRRDLVDDIVITLMPVILGDGVLFFDYVGRERDLHLKDVCAYSDGLVELTYQIKRE